MGGRAGRRRARDGSVAARDLRPRSGRWVLWSVCQHHVRATEKAVRSRAGSRSEPRRRPRTPPEQARIRQLVSTMALFSRFAVSASSVTHQRPQPPRSPARAGSAQNSAPSGTVDKNSPAKPLRGTGRPTTARERSRSQTDDTEMTTTAIFSSACSSSAKRRSPAGRL